MSEQRADHWLTRATTIRRIWHVSTALLAVIVLLEWLVPIKGYFVLDGWPGFGAVFGFLSCLVMVLATKAIGYLLKRSQDYYVQDSSVEDERDE